MYVVVTTYKLKIMSFCHQSLLFIHTSSLDHISFMLPLEYLSPVPNCVLSGFITQHTPGRLKYLYFNCIVHLLFSVDYCISVFGK
jgi:hypothetical protein